MIKREQTAIKRVKPSKPIKNLLKYDFYNNANNDILDFGCGLGYDINYQKELGLNVDGYDKFINPYDKNDYIFNKYYDIVTCNYVINVIEDIEERQWLINTLLNRGDKIIITVRTDKKSIKNTWTPYKDGYITPKNIFQKIYDYKEFMQEFKYFIDNYGISVLHNGHDYLQVMIIK